MTDEDGRVVPIDDDYVLTLEMIDEAVEKAKAIKPAVEPISHPKLYGGKPFYSMKIINADRDYLERTGWMEFEPGLWVKPEDYERAAGTLGA